MIAGAFLPLAVLPGPIGALVVEALRTVVAVVEAVAPVVAVVPVLATVLTRILLTRRILPLGLLSLGLLPLGLLPLGLLPSLVGRRLIRRLGLLAAVGRRDRVPLPMAPLPDDPRAWPEWSAREDVADLQRAGLLDPPVAAPRPGATPPRLRAADLRLTRRGVLLHRLLALDLLHEDAVTEALAAPPGSLSTSALKRRPSDRVCAGSSGSPAASNGLTS